MLIAKGFEMKTGGSILFLLAVLFLLLACSGDSGPPPIEKRILGVWDGLQTNGVGDKLPASWEFVEGGKLIVNIKLMDVTYLADWYVDGNRIHITTEIQPDKPTYRDAEFLNDNMLKLTKDDTIEETWVRRD